MLLTRENILATTRNGLHLYCYILREHYPTINMAKIINHEQSAPNPFVLGGRLVLQPNNGTYEHRDLNFPDFKGTAFDLAGLHFRTATLNELYYMINQTLKLGLQIPTEELLEHLDQVAEQAELSKFSSFRPPITNTTPSETLTLPLLFRRIIGTQYRKATETLRGLQDSKEARKYKATHFPYVTFGGCFTSRNDKDLVAPSGLIVIDLDDLKELESIRESLISQESYETELLFLSPSGTGLKWVTSYLHQEISHREQFEVLCSYLEAVFGLKADASGKDMSRACFICADPSAFLNGKYLFPRSPSSGLTTRYS